MERKGVEFQPCRRKRRKNYMAVSGKSAYFMHFIWCVRVSIRINSLKDIDIRNYFTLILIRRQIASHENFHLVWYFFLLKNEKPHRWRSMKDAEGKKRREVNSKIDLWFEANIFLLRKCFQIRLLRVRECYGSILYELNRIIQ